MPTKYVTKTVEKAAPKSAPKKVTRLQLVQQGLASRDSRLSPFY